MTTSAKKISAAGAHHIPRSPATQLSMPGKQVKKVAKDGRETGFFVQNFIPVKVTYQYVR